MHSDNLRFLNTRRRACPLCFFLLLTLVAVGRPATATDLTDLAGHTVHFERPFTRIISLYGAHTENLARLGLDSEIIGRTAEDDYPSTLLPKPVFSDRDDPERFIAAHPDLILIRPMIDSSAPELFNKLRESGIAVVSLQPTTIAQMYDYWRDLGALTGKTAAAEAMIRDFQAELQRIGGKLAAIPQEQRPRVYFESIHAKMRTFSPESIAVFSLTSAGGINIAADATPRHATNIAEYGKERILSRAAEIDVFVSQTGRMNPVAKTDILNEPGFQAIKAIRNGRVFLIEEKLVSRPTMRLLQGIRQLNDLLYPEIGQTGNR